eukprot:13173679-Alexandrium_andersonii.AAC.1
MPEPTFASKAAGAIGATVGASAPTARAEPGADAPPHLPSCRSRWRRGRRQCRGLKRLRLRRLRR